MGLTIILGILLGLALICGGDKPPKVKYTVGDYISSILAGCVVALILTFTITVLVTEILSNEDNYFVVIDTQVDELQEIIPDVYLTSDVETGYQAAEFITIIVQVDNKTKKIPLEDSSINLNSHKHTIETHKHDFANSILRWLLFSPSRNTYTIYTPQNELTGDFTIR